MARPCRWRRICTEPEFDRFVPEGIPSPGSITLTVDEYEAVRLIDLMKCTHEQCAAQMDISRTTVTEIYESARTKIADSLIGGKTLVIAGGRYRLCDGTGPLCCHRCRRNAAQSPQQITEKGEHTMRIAVTYENGTIFQHFGHTEQFKLYDVENGEIRHSEVVDTNGSGHGALAGFLTAHQVDALICGGIGGGAQTVRRCFGQRRRSCSSACSRSADLRSERPLHPSRARTRQRPSHLRRTRLRKALTQKALSDE